MFVRNYVLLSSTSSMTLTIMFNTVRLYYLLEYCFFGIIEKCTGFILSQKVVLYLDNEVHTLYCIQAIFPLQINASCCIVHCVSVDVNTLFFVGCDRYARKHFPPANVDGTMTKEIQRAMALLAFKPETSCSPYRVNKINETLSPTCRQILFDWGQ